MRLRRSLKNYRFNANEISCNNSMRFALIPSIIMYIDCATASSLHSLIFVTFTLMRPEECIALNLDRYAGVSC